MPPFKKGQKVIVKIVNSHPLVGYKKGDTGVYVGMQHFKMYDGTKQWVPIIKRQKQIFKKVIKVKRIPRAKLAGNNAWMCPKDGTPLRGWSTEYDDLLYCTDCGLTFDVFTGKHIGRLDSVISIGMKK